MNKSKYLNDILTSFESEEIISKRLIEIKYDMIGSKEFILHHSYINKLNMQEVKNILVTEGRGEDIIMTQFIDNEQFKPLIKELYTINTFKYSIYPKIKEKIANYSSIKSYLILYHEACVVNLIENFLYSITACQAADDYIIDIIEYAYKMISKYVNYKTLHPNEIIGYKEPLDMKSLEEKIKNTDKKKEYEENVNELDEKFKEIDFAIAMSSINILRYISDHLEQLEFPVRHHMMNVKDVPMLFVTLMEMKPWLRKIKKYNSESKKDEEIIQIYENNNWVNASSLQFKLPKLEYQVWITIYNLVMNQDNNKKYEMTEYRQNQLLRLRKFFSDTLYDKIPQMLNLYRSLEQMSLMTYGNSLTVNPFIVEMIPVLSNNKLFKLSDEESTKIGNEIVKKYFENLSKEELRKELEPINEIYNVDNMEYFMDDPKCANCGKDASQRCSRCKSEWYCSRECQVKRWKIHKQLCKTLETLFKEEEGMKNKKEFNSIKTKIDNNYNNENNVKIDNNEIKNKKVLVEEIKPEIKKKEEEKKEEIKEEVKEEVVEVKNNDLDDLD